MPTNKTLVKPVFFYSFDMLLIGIVFKGHLHEVKSAQTSAPKTVLARPFIK
jgi:hypothetical protein